VAYDVALAPDGQTLAVACRDRAVYLFSRDGVLEQALRGHGDHVLSVAFAPAGGELYSLSWAGELIRWVLPQGGKQVLRPPGSSARRIAVSADGKLVALGRVDGVVELISASDGRQVRRLPAHRGSVLALAFRPGKPQLASAGIDQPIRLWAMPSGELLQSITDHKGAVTRLVFGPDGERLVSGGRDGGVRIHALDPATKQRVVVRGHDDSIMALAFAPRVELIASAAGDREVRLWQANTGSALGGHSVHRSFVMGLAFSPDGTVLASAGYDRSVVLWQPALARARPNGAAHAAGVTRASFSADGRRILSAGADRRIGVWRSESGELLKMIAGHESGVSEAVELPDGGDLASAGYDRSVRLWTRAGKAVAILRGHSGKLRGLSASPDGKTILSYGDDATLRLWARDRISPLRTFSGHRSSVVKARFARDGQSFASASMDGSVRLWQANKGWQSRILHSGAQPVFGMDYSQGGRRLVAVGDEGIVRLWDLARGTVRVVTQGLPRTVDVAFHPDGSRLGLASADGNARIVTIDDPARTIVLRGHRGEVNSIAFSNDGTRALTASDDGTVRLWRAGDGMPLWRTVFAGVGSGEVLSQAGWRAISGGDGVPRIGPVLRRYLGRNARRATLSPSNATICLETLEHRIELWRGFGVQPLASDTAVQPAALVAIDQGCVFIDGARARHLRYDEQRTRVVRAAIDGQAQTLGRFSGGFLVGAGGWVRRLDADGKPLGRLALGADATAVGQVQQQIAAGDARGQIRLIGSSGANVVIPALEAAPAAAVTWVGDGPRGTMVVGYADGHVGLWELAGGRKINGARLHGPIDSVVETRGALFAASQLGDGVTWNTAVLYRPYCSVLRDVWDRVSQLWIGGRLIKTGRPREHGCLRPTGP
jgi:WD40 repeat protein